MAFEEEIKIEVEGLYKIFGDNPEAAFAALHDDADKQSIFEQTGQVVAVQNTSFKVARGEVFVVMGLSGSGKSTIVRMLNRLIEPTAGRITVNGKDITAMNRRELVAFRQRDIAMVFQSFALMPHLTSLENAAFGLEVAGMKKKERDERARAALETVGLAAYAGSHPDELSGGMQQRVGLARALAVEPSIMLMDEAFSALDPLIRVEMQDELVRIKEERDLTVVFISHDLDEALRIGDRIAIMDDGAIVQIGAPQDLINNPATEYVRTFFGRADMAKAFTAGDLARIDPSVVIRRPPDDIGAAIRVLERAGQSYGYLQGPRGRFEGVVSMESLRKARDRRKHHLADALFPSPGALYGDLRLEACLGPVAATPFPMPVIGEDGRFLGTISRTRLLKALNREA